MSNPAYTGLSPRISSRFIQVNDLSVHILESLPAAQPAPLILLLHGFPELSYSWRHILVPLSDAGYHVVAPDQRGYGLTTPCSPSYTDDLTPYSMPSLVSDIHALVQALDHTSLFALIGHDFGSLVAGFTALTHPELTSNLVLMSAPFPGIPTSKPVHSLAEIDAQFAKLDPPKKHYTTYFSSPSANDDMLHPSDGLRAFLHSYFLAKSESPECVTGPLPSASAADMAAHLPTYYVMPLHLAMPEVVHPAASSSIRDTDWLTPESLSVYTTTFSHTGFQGGLNWYRALRGLPTLFPETVARLAGRTIPGSVKALFVAGRRDWGVWQTFGAVDRMRVVCEGMREGNDGVKLIEGAGHWVQQEKPEEVVQVLLDFLGTVSA